MLVNATEEDGMATYLSQTPDGGDIMVEVETTGAFAKSDLEFEVSPATAYQQGIAAIGRVGSHLAQEVRQHLQGTKSQVEVRFGVKLDGNGMVMLSMTPEGSQFDVTIRFNAS